MKKLKRFYGLLLTCITFSFSVTTQAAEITIAVASNFVETLSEISKQFEQQTGNTLTLIPGSTGKHYAQIKNGAPFHAFFAADSKRPQLLEEEGVAIAGSRFTYAVGKILLWSPQQDLVDADGEVLKNGTFRHLSIANPKLAPYGAAAREVLESAGLWDALQERIVRGENIGQTFHFVKSGNAELGFIAKSQVKKPQAVIPGSWWEVPQERYAPIEQQAVLLKDDPVIREFLIFFQSDAVKELIRQYGYDTP